MRKSRIKHTAVTSPLERGKGTSVFVDPRRTFFAPGYPSEGYLPVGWLGDFSLYSIAAFNKEPCGKNE